MVGSYLRLSLAAGAIRSSAGAWKRHRQESRLQGSNLHRRGQSSSACQLAEAAVPGERIELPLAVSEAAVLPLDEPGIVVSLVAIYSPAGATPRLAEPAEAGSKSAGPDACCTGDLCRPTRAP